MSHAAHLLVIIRREEERRAKEQARKERLAKLSPAMRATLTAADETVERNRLLRERADLLLHH